MTIAHTPGERSGSNLVAGILAGTALTLAATTTTNAAYLYDMPFKGEDFPDNTKVFRGKAIHSGSGVQMHGYDLGAKRFSASEGEWTEYTVASSTFGSDPRNAYFVVYNKPLYAMRSGKVVGCWRNAPENPNPGQTHWALADNRMPGGGNLLWVDHSDGTRALYAHMIPGTIPASLCSKSDALFPQSTDNEWTYVAIPAAQQPTVTKGQFIGRVGNAGSSSAPHFHGHLEKGGNPEIIRFKRGISATPDNNDRYGKWTRFAGNQIPPGPVLIWPARTNTAEYARHGFNIAGYQALFSHLADSGLKPYWLDGYRVGNNVYLNTLWRPASGLWRSFHGLTPGSYQNRVTEADEDGYVPVFVDSYRSPGGVRYNVIFQKSTRGWLARHGLSYAQHLSVIDQAKSLGMSPVNISVVSVGGDRRYTVLYHKKSIGSWSIKSRLSSAAYQNEVTNQKSKGRTPRYVNAYVHNGVVNYTAVFAQNPVTSWKARHGLTSSGYQAVWSDSIGKGFRTHVVTGIDGTATVHRFAGVWRK